MPRRLFTITVTAAVLCCMPVTAEEKSPLKDAKDGLTVNKDAALSSLAGQWPSAMTITRYLW